MENTSKAERPSDPPVSSAGATGVPADKNYTHAEPSVQDVSIGTTVVNSSQIALGKSEVLRSKPLAQKVAAAPPRRELIREMKEFTKLDDRPLTGRRGRPRRLPDD
ncbi:hypothetical protein EVAR_48442_1 [Eumeta japonica]|uniref:Uncharacterized protein n=1 Tax=Eumeta variegata TaxID=151549 RepID=A0A4C1XU71_EUMVA|nr:hypothetical protein EVAR_48442_1 [Eumeta japonica]